MLKDKIIRGHIKCPLEIFINGWFLRVTLILFLMPLSETDIKKRTSQFHPSASHPSKLVSNNFLCQVQCRNLIWREKLLPTPIPLDTMGYQSKLGIFFYSKQRMLPEGVKKRLSPKKQNSHYHLQSISINCKQ